MNYGDLHPPIARAEGAGEQRVLLLEELELEDALDWIDFHPPNARASRFIVH